MAEPQLQICRSGDLVIHRGAEGLYLLEGPVCRYAVQEQQRPRPAAALPMVYSLQVHGSGHLRYVRRGPGRGLLTEQPHPSLARFRGHPPVRVQPGGTPEYRTDCLD